MSQPQIAVIDYSKGNLRSVQKGLGLAGATAWISADPDAIARADALVLPGVGSFADASATMLATGQMQMIRQRVRAGVPFLGICLGLQLLFERGDEGVAEAAQTQAGADSLWAEGLGLLPGSCRRLDAQDLQGRSYKVPHVGWNQVEYCGVVAAAAGLGAAADAAAASDPSAVTSRTQAVSPSPLFDGIADGSNFYFTHSYQADPLEKSDCIAITSHAQSFTAAVQRDNIFATQFHPEKSSQKGLAVLKNFVRIVQQS